MAKNILEKLKELKNSVFKETNNEEVLEETEETNNEEVMNSIIEDKVEMVEEVLEETEEEVEKVSEENNEIIGELNLSTDDISSLLVDKLMSELEEVKTKLAEKENILAEIENNKKLDIKKSFLMENNIPITDSLLKMEMDDLKNIINSVAKVTVKAPNVFDTQASAPIIKNDAGFNTGLKWENLSTAEKNMIYQTDKNLFDKLFASRKK